MSSVDGRYQTVTEEDKRFLNEVLERSGRVRALLGLNREPNISEMSTAGSFTDEDAAISTRLNAGPPASVPEPAGLSPDKSPRIEQYQPVEPSPIKSPGIGQYQPVESSPNKSPGIEQYQPVESSPNKSPGVGQYQPRDQQTTAIPAKSNVAASVPQTVTQEQYQPREQQTTAIPARSNVAAGVPHTVTRIRDAQIAKLTQQHQQRTVVDVNVAAASGRTVGAGQDVRASVPLQHQGVVLGRPGSTPQDRGAQRDGKSWLDALVDQAWPYFRAAIQPMIEQPTKSAIRSSLKSYVKSLDFLRFDLLGNDAPQINAECVRVDGEGEKQPLLKMDLHWQNKDQAVFMRADLGQIRAAPPARVNVRSDMCLNTYAEFPVHSLAEMMFPKDVVKSAHEQRHPRSSADKIYQSGYSRMKTPDGREFNAEEKLPTNLIAALWPYLEAFIEWLGWTMLPGILDSTTPSWMGEVELKKFEAGGVPPKMWNVRVFQDEHDVVPDIFIDFEFEWNSNFDMEVVVHAFPESLSFLPDIIENPLKKLLTLQAGVESIDIRGEARVVLRPMMEKFPIVGAITAGFVKMPQIDFDVTMMGGPAPMLPFVKQWLKNMAKDYILGPYTVPDAYVYKIDPDVKVVSPADGVLEVTLIEAVNVPKMDFLQKSSPFCDLFVQHSYKVHTQTVERSHRPTWNETFVLPVKEAELQSLTIILWDYDEWVNNDEIGRASIPVTEIPEGEQQDVWLEVSGGSKDQEEEKKMRKRDKAMQKLAQPFSRQQPSGCSIHTKLTFHPFSRWHVQLLAGAQRDGIFEVLRRPGVVDRLDPFMLNTFMSGSAQVKLISGHSIPVKEGWLTSPKVKVEVSIADECKASTFFKVKKNNVKFDETVDLRVDGRLVVARDTRSITLKVVDDSGRSLGSADVPLSVVVGEGKFEGVLLLEGLPPVKQLHINVTWTWLILH